MFEKLFERYGQDLDQTLRQVADLVPESASALGIMVRYPFGWVDETGQAYAGVTGKRIRPLFLLLCNEAAGGDWRQALYAAAAVEYVHNFSLVHDDIQDDSPIRHNRPTAWKIWGRPNAINIGDALFALSYAALHKLTDAGVSAATLINVYAILNQTTLELTRGQYLDMAFETRGSVSVPEYVSMITGKSAALLAACAEIGSLIATNDQMVAQRYAEFALNLGIAFQIRDDFLGIWGDAAIIGKSTATDIRSRKKSLPVLFGLKSSQILADIYHQEILTDADVQSAVEELERVGARDYTLKVEKEYYDKSLLALEQAGPKGETAEWLHQFVDELFGRSY